jgi:hypothetical protein
MLEHKVFVVIDPDKSARSISQVSEVVLLIKFLILYNHVSFAYATELGGCVVFSIGHTNGLHLTIHYTGCFLLDLLTILLLISDNEVIIMFACLKMLLLTANYGATIFLLPLGGHKSLSIYDELGSDHAFHAFHNLYVENWCDSLLLFRNQDALNWLV